MIKRREVREIAMQALFSMDMQEEFSVNNGFSFWDYFGYKDTDDLFFKDIVNGYVENSENIDSVIEKVSKNWKVNRMPYVDRNIIRIAAFEILYRKDIPPNVSINEAIDISKKFGTKNSGSFINGILDKISSLNEIE